jgi:alanyl-tRNA synthetase
MADSFRDRIGSGVIVLVADIDGKVSIVSTVTKDIVKNHSLSAGDIVRELASKVDGSGGGKQHFAMAGGKNVSGIQDVLSAVPSLLLQLAAARG